MFSPNLVVGLAIMAFGVVLLLDRLGVAGAWDLLKYWPALLVAFGASIAFQSFRRRDPSAPPPPKSVVSPGFVLFLVVAAMFASNALPRLQSRSTGGEHIHLIGVMGNTHRTSTSSDFSGATLGGVMGRSTLDLRHATIPAGKEGVVDVFALMGKVVLIVPDHWKVDTTALPIMGAVSDRRWPRTQPAQPPADQPAQPPADQPVEAPAGQPVEAPAGVEAATPGAEPRLVLRGFVMMGKVEIQS